MPKAPADRRFPVFVLIATKFKAMANMKPLLEFALSSDSAPSRLPSAAELVSSVKGIQQFAAVRAGIAKGTFNADARWDGVTLKIWHFFFLGKIK